MNSSHGAVVLWNEPSPLEPVNWKPFLNAGVSLFMKRDDLIHPVISGNKWRKLKYLIQFARDQNYEQLVSFGGAYSNHLPALAVAAKAFGFHSVGFVRGEELTIDSNQQLAVCADAGMELHFVSRELYRKREWLFSKHFGNNPLAMMIDEGGKSKYALPGCREIIYELNIRPDHILTPVGSGTTIAGILQGAAETFPCAVVHGIVVLKSAEYLDQEVIKLLGSGKYQYIMHHRFHVGGFAKGKIELQPIIADFKEQTGIRTEYIYSGKMLQAALQLLNEGVFKQGERVVLLHTGGVWG